MLRITTWLQRANSSPVIVPETRHWGWAVSLKYFRVTSSCRRAIQPSDTYVKIKRFVHSRFHGIFLEMPSLMGLLLHGSRKVSAEPFFLLPHVQGRRPLAGSGKRLGLGTQKDRIYICRKPLMFTGLRGLCEQANLPSPARKSMPHSSSLK